ncbi:MAG: Rdx family protein [Alicyclobacillus sp.]|nr:Rdx family protein [Alicyclobacillus sp.]
MAEEVLSKFHPKISEFKLVPSSGGVFEVSVGEELVFSKKALGRFPEEGEIAQEVERKLG